MAYNKVPKIICYECINRHHLVTACPKCDTGVVVATCPEDYNGIAEGSCNDCSADIAFYVVIGEHRAWLLSEPLQVVEARHKRTKHLVEGEALGQQPPP